MRFKLKTWKLFWLINGFCFDWFLFWLTLYCMFPVAIWQPQLFWVQMFLPHLCKHFVWSVIGSAVFFCLKEHRGYILVDFSEIYLPCISFKEVLVFEDYKRYSEEKISYVSFKFSEVCVVFLFSFIGFPDNLILLIFS